MTDIKQGETRVDRVELLSLACIPGNKNMPIFKRRGMLLRRSLGVAPRYNLNMVENWKPLTLAGIGRASKRDM